LTPDRTDSADADALHGSGATGFRNRVRWFAHGAAESVDVAFGGKTTGLNQAVTEIVEMPNRGHALVIDSGWREVADTALTFVRRFV
jgi:hypothetical protein